MVFVLGWVKIFMAILVFSAVSQLAVDTGGSRCFRTEWQVVIYADLQTERTIKWIHHFVLQHARLQRVAIYVLLFFYLTALVNTRVLQMLINIKEMFCSCFKQIHFHFYNHFLAFDFCSGVRRAFCKHIYLYSLIRVTHNLQNPSAKTLNCDLSLQCANKG